MCAHSRKACFCCLIDEWNSGSFASQQGLFGATTPVLKVNDAVDEERVLLLIPQEVALKVKDAVAFSKRELNGVSRSCFEGMECSKISNT